MSFLDLGERDAGHIALVRIRCILRLGHILPAQGRNCGVDLQPCRIRRNAEDLSRLVNAHEWLTFTRRFAISVRKYVTISSASVRNRYRILPFKVLAVF